MRNPMTTHPRPALEAWLASVDELLAETREPADAGRAEDASGEEEAA
jgi:hypothetical protein